MKDERYTVLLTRYQKSGSGEWYEDTVLPTSHWSTIRGAVDYAALLLREHSGEACTARIDKIKYDRDWGTWEYLSRSSLKMQLQEGNKVMVTDAGMGVTN